MRLGILGLLLNVLVITAISLSAQVYTQLTAFTGQNGANPVTALTQGADGKLYGTTYYGGGGQYSFCGGEGNGCGTVFSVTTDGTLITLHAFCSQQGCIDGSEPSGPLVIGPNGNFYGTTQQGGSHNSGTVYMITTAGVLTSLHSFSGAEGFDPEAGLVLARDGNFYGTTKWGGSHGEGTVFSMTPGGVVTTLYSFCTQSNCSDGYFPVGTLIQATDGNLYGTAAYGGAGYGTVFKISLGGSLTTLHTFNGDDGSTPDAGLIQAKDGNFYGTTFGTGSGTVFKMTPDGTLSILWNFSGYPIDGGNPQAPLIQAMDGNFYGTTSRGGDNDWGTAFELTAAGKLITLHSFSLNDGITMSGLMQAADGYLYGTSRASTNCYPECGVVFRLEPYLPLSVVKSGMGIVSGPDGHIYCGDRCSYSYSFQSETTLSAVPAPGYTFTGWAGCDNVNGSYCSVTMTSAKNVTATFTAANVTLTSLTLKPSYVKGGQLSAGTLTLSGPAPDGGVTVALSSDHPNVAHPPAFVFVPGGKSSVGFAVNTFPVHINTSVVVTATAGSSHVSGTLTVGTTFSLPSLK